ncbi:MAG: hypothetical protein ABEJ25_03480 [Candidatus Bipolaricaulia bacterium]
MNKVYIVSDGCYDDYRILGIYTDQEAAENLASHSEEMRVEEHILNREVDLFKQGKCPYLVVMDVNGNNLEGIQDIQATPFPGLTDYIGYEITYAKNEGKPMLSNICWAMNGEEAIKITDDLRNRLIARDEFYAG